MPYPNATQGASLNPANVHRTAWLLAAVLAFLPTVAAAESCGLLWRIETRGASTSHLFGTVHSEDARVVDLPQPVVDAFKSSDVYAMEMIPDLQVITELFRAMHFQDQRNLKGVLGEDLFERATDALSEHGIGKGLAMKMKPWAVAVTLSFPRPETGQFLDIMLFNRAMAAGKRTVGLERADEQLAFFTDLSMAEQITLLEATLQHFGEIEETMNRVVEAWLSRDPEALTDLSQSYLSELPDEMADRFHEQAIDARNRRMFERMAPLLEAGNVFVAVGALHLYGDEGLLELLKENGHSVECIH